MSNLTIRRAKTEGAKAIAKKDEAKAIAELELRVCGPRSDGLNAAEAWERDLKGPKNTTYVCEANGECIGVLLLKHSQERKDRYLILKLIVDSNQTSNDVHTALINAAKEHIKSASIRLLEFNKIAQNDPLVNVLKSHGFIKVEQPTKRGTETTMIWNAELAP